MRSCCGLNDRSSIDGIIAGLVTSILFEYSKSLLAFINLKALGAAALIGFLLGGILSAIIDTARFNQVKETGSRQDLLCVALSTFLSYMVLSAIL